jgi:hypothetical protein
MAVTLRRPVAVVLALRAHDLGPLDRHQLVDDTEPDHGGSSRPLGLGVVAPNAPNRNGPGRQDRRSKFYEIPDNLDNHPTRANGVMLSRMGERSLSRDPIVDGFLACAQLAASAAAGYRR